MTTVCVLPARGGSKRITRKNVRPFAGRPMVAWPIGIALSSGLFDRVVVSTDDDDIAAVARFAGAETPFMRPAALADDFSSTLAVMAHAVSALALAGDDLVCCVYPTAALMLASDLANGRDALVADAGSSYAVSVVRYPHPIERAMDIDGRGRLSLRDARHATTRSQDLKPAVHDAGQFYWGRADAFARGESMLGPGSRAVVLPAWRVVDIDTEDDWIRAERLFARADSGGRKEPGHS